MVDQASSCFLDILGGRGSYISRYKALLNRGEGVISRGDIKPNCCGTLNFLMKDDHVLK